jgi:hypothetical protein
MLTMTMTLPPRHPCLIRLSHALLRKAERSRGERAASLAFCAASRSPCILRSRFSMVLPMRGRTKLAMSA